MSSDAAMVTSSYESIFIPQWRYARAFSPCGSTPSRYAITIVSSNEAYVAPMARSTPMSCMELWRIMCWYWWLWLNRSLATFPWPSRCDILMHHGKDSLPSVSIAAIGCPHLATTDLPYTSWYFTFFLISSMTCMGASSPRSSFPSCSKSHQMAPWNSVECRPAAG